MNGSPHLPAHIRQWYGDSRGHWEGNTLVIDVTNFSPKTDYQGSRENLHLVERWTRTGPTSLEYVVTAEDPRVWTRPWTAKQEFTRQSDVENRLYYEPRCIEGNAPQGRQSPYFGQSSFASKSSSPPALARGGQGWQRRTPLAGWRAHFEREVTAVTKSG
jgi:hypothetical protein